MTEEFYYAQPISNHLINLQRKSFSLLFIFCCEYSSSDKESLSDSGGPGPKDTSTTAEKPQPTKKVHVSVMR